MEYKKVFDDLVKCDRCDGDACYINEVTANIKSHYCFGCGFNTNSIMTVGSAFLKEQMSTLPDLYKDLMGEDSKGKVWMPAFVSNEQGMVYVEGTSAENWRWAAVKMIPTTKEDGEIISKQKVKPDNDSKKFFDEKGFMDALSYVGLLPDNKKDE